MLVTIVIDAGPAVSAPCGSRAIALWHDTENGFPGVSGNVADPVIVGASGHSIETSASRSWLRCTALTGVPAVNVASVYVGGGIPAATWMSLSAARSSAMCVARTGRRTASAGSVQANGVSPRS